MENNNLESSRTKCLVKVVLYYAAFLILLVALSFFKSFFPQNLGQLSFGLFGLISALLTTALFLRKDKKTFREIGLTYQNTTFRKFITGLAIGIVLMGLVTVLVVFFSGFSVEANPNSGFLNFTLWTLPLIPLALMEEIPARGYALVTLREKFGVRLTVVMTSLLFACSHLAYGWSVADSLMGPGIMGLIFGMLAIYSNGIAVPTGVHYGFNLVTAAFAANDQSFNLWVLKSADGTSLENHQPSLLATLLPNVFFLLAGVMLMELYLRRKPPVQAHV